MNPEDQGEELRKNALHHAKDVAEAEEIFKEVKEALTEQVAEQIAQKYRDIKVLDNQKKALQEMEFTDKN